jgi:gluconate 5-dehydrogenase
MLERSLRGRFGAFEGLVDATVFLRSDASRHVTGQLLYLDGGYMASIQVEQSAALDLLADG